MRGSVRRRTCQSCHQEEEGVEAEAEVEVGAEEEEELVGLHCLGDHREKIGKTSLILMTTLT